MNWFLPSSIPDNETSRGVPRLVAILDVRFAAFWLFAARPHLQDRLVGIVIKTEDSTVPTHGRGVQTQMAMVNA
jgi:hypothetical protein